MASHRLSERQQHAVNSDDRALLVVAGAGSGKTEVVAHRLERLLSQSQSPDSRVLGLTYTLKASEELRERLESRLGVLSKRADTDTIHGFALSLLRTHGTQIGLPLDPEVVGNDDDRATLASEMLGNLGRPSDLASARAFLVSVDLQRAEEIDSELVERWRDALAERAWLDFAAVLEAGTALVESPFLRRILPIRYSDVVIDEAQNLTKAQFRFVRALLGVPPDQRISVCVVGDERQSIFHFAGARPELLAQFAEDYSATRIELNVDFRSSLAIRGFAERIDASVRSAPIGEFTVAPGHVELHEAADEEAEAGFVVQWLENCLANGLSAQWCLEIEDTQVTPEQCAVLARSGAALGRTAEKLRDKGIEHSVASSADEWMASNEGRLVLNLVAALGSPDHSAPQLQMQRSLRECNGALGKQILAADRNNGVAALVDTLVSLNGSDEWLSDAESLSRTWAEWRLTVQEGDVSFRAFANHLERVRRMEPNAKGVRLLTVHRAQGREFKAVLIVGCNKGQFPDFRAATPEEFAIERKTFYVAVTRASRALVLTRAKSRLTKFGSRSTEPSEFLAIGGVR